MKDYIKRLAKGDFDYVTPKLTDIVDEIECDIVEGKVSKLEMSINATSNIKGIIYSSDRRVKVVNNTCYGTHNIIEYTVDTRGLKTNEIITGVFTYVTGASEAETSYKFRVTECYVRVSGEEMFNMFHFTELFKNSPEEAIKVFRRENFSHVFLHDDTTLVNIYSIFAKEANTRQAIEEFLIAVKKKSPVIFSIESDNKEYDYCAEDIGEIIKIVSDGWGYCELNIHTDCQFIKLDRTHITTEEFVGNMYELEYAVVASKLYAGNNSGRIFIETNNQNMSILVTVHNSSTVSPQARARKRLTYGLTKEYLDYRMGYSDKAQWIDNSLADIEDAKNLGVEGYDVEIAYAQMLITKRKSDEGMSVLEAIEGKIVDEKENNELLYCYFLYVKSLALKDAEYTLQTANIISGYIGRGNSDWRMLWLSFYTDKTSDKNKSVKLARLKDAFHDGCTSPVMYFEACAVFNDSPHLLRMLNEFEIQVIYFGCRYEILSNELAMQICDIVDNTRSANSSFLKILKVLNEKREDDRVLSALTKQMIRNDITGKNAAAIYEKSILRGLRITSLYEYYMASIELSQKTRIPKMVLLYFVYESNMSYKLKAFLYEYVLENQSMFPDIYSAYEKQIESFAFNQVKLMNVDDNLAKIYKTVLRPELITKENAFNIFNLLFTYKVTCFDENVSFVVVKHKELNFENKYSVSKGVSYIRIFSENAAIAFEYRDGSRRMNSVVYEIEKLFEAQELLQSALEQSNENIYTSICLNESNIHKVIGTSTDLNMNRALLKSDKISEIYRKTVNSRIIACYHDGNVGDDFREEFKQIIKEKLDSIDASKLIETCITNEMYDDAFALISEYGFDRILPDKICMLARYMITLDSGNQDELLLDMCKYAFDNKKYDEIILRHMVKYFNDSTDEMYAVWKACINFNEDNMELAERIIAQMLFTQNHSGRLTEVFTYYYNNGARNTVVEAYLSYNAFLYFVKQRKANNIVFTVIENKLNDDYRAPDVCKLALLKHYSEQTALELSDSGKKTAQRILDEMCDEDIVFSFYKKFNGILTIPYNIIDKTVVEYRGNPDSKVTIHYILSDNKTTDKYTVETMTSKIFGIFTVSYTLFYGDTLEYYVTEKNKNDVETNSEKYTIMCNEINPDETKGRFDYLNDIFASKKLHDGATMKKLMHGYSVLEYVSKQMFKPLD